MDKAYPRKEIYMANQQGKMPFLIKEKHVKTVVRYWFSPKK